MEDHSIVPEASSSSTVTRADALLKKHAVKLTDKFSIGQNTINLGNGEKVAQFCRTGNFSILTGGAKMGKSYFSSYLAAFGHYWSNYYGLKVLYIDTEQSKDVVQNLNRRIHKIFKIAESPTLDVLSLRSETPNRRREIVSTIIEEQGDQYSLVIIDGIKDLVNSINNEEESNSLVSDVLKWTEEKNLHILTVIHQNKSNNNTRGHLGTELTNKAELQMDIVKKGDKFFVTSKYDRYDTFPPIEFFIKDDLPHVSFSSISKVIKSKKAALRPKDCPKEEVEKIIRAAYSTHASMSKNMLGKGIRSSAKDLGIEFGDSVAREWCVYYIEEGIVKLNAEGKFAIAC